MPMCDEETGWCVWWTLQRSRFCLFGSARGGLAQWQVSLYGIFGTALSMVLRISSSECHWWLSLGVVMCKRDCNGDWCRPWRVVIEEYNLVFLGTGGHWGMSFRITIEIVMVGGPAQLLSPPKMFPKNPQSSEHKKIDNTHADTTRWRRQSSIRPYCPLRPLHPRCC